MHKWVSVHVTCMTVVLWVSREHQRHVDTKKAWLLLVTLPLIPSGELSSQLPEKLSLVIGSILGALAFLLLAAITVLAVIFQR